MASSAKKYTLCSAVKSYSSKKTKKKTNIRRPNVEPFGTSYSVTAEKFGLFTDNIVDYI